MNRPYVKLLLSMLALCAFAALATGCAEHRSDWLGGLAFDLIGIAVQGVVGN
jgi:hypothetical protein